MVSVLQDETSNITDLYKDMLHTMEDLATCSYTTGTFTKLLSRLQAVVGTRREKRIAGSLICYRQIDRLNLERCANLDYLVAELDEDVEDTLLQQLKHVIQAWCAGFDRSADDGDLRRDALPSKRRGENQRGEKFLEGSIMLKPTVHRIWIRNPVIFLDPPMECVRDVDSAAASSARRVGSSWYNACVDKLFPGVICLLQRI
ncbi:hypothetical protein BC834DRAFT_690417 [Gloeopeniophorella convolvens]|nr:hypothetical protein BC834DRAFT_690417 [Gloeopeniophorella convolvens]